MLTSPFLNVATKPPTYLAVIVASLVIPLVVITALSPFTIPAIPPAYALEVNVVISAFACLMLAVLSTTPAIPPAYAEACWEVNVNSFAFAYASTISPLL